jgi:hypothetical protein
MAKKYIFSLDSSIIDVSFVGGGLEIEIRIAQDLINMCFPRLALSGWPWRACLIGRTLERLILVLNLASYQSSKVLLMQRKVGTPEDILCGEGNEA